ncbi:MAG: tripartite tricarboxylate transporter permease [Alphaproteobacteria bacterium]|nr:tripartite tricarboxylate transporter permease [Alphaproteobacteria bacterium]
MDVFASLIDGFAVALRPENLLFALIGSIIGTAVGVLPGIGPIAGIAILLPLTFKLDATGAIIMLSAIYYGAMYGGTITAVLMNVPGEGASAVTCVDGYRMAKTGRAGAALAIAAIASFVGGTVATIVLVFAAPPLAAVALNFGPPEFFALMVLGLVLLIAFSGDRLILGLLSALLGMALAIPGMDFVEGTPRLTFGIRELSDGIGFVPVIMGLYGIGEVLHSLERKAAPTIEEAKVSATMLTAEEMKASAAPIARGTAVGIFLGLIPGIGTILPTLASYALEKKVSRHPERFGHGAIEGVAAPEATNNAYANGALIPLFTLGVPASPTIAVLLGAFMMNGLQPGPFLFRDKPDFVWGVIASLYIGNLILLVLNLPLVGLWVRLLKVPHSILFSLILAFTLLGAFVTSNSLFDIGVLIVFGVVGYLFKKLDIPIAPMAFTLILGPLTENSLRQALSMSGGELSILFRGYTSTGLLILAAVALLYPMISALRARSG